MQTLTKLRRRDALRRFQARKLRRLLECDDSTIREIAKAVDECEGLGAHLRSALPPGVDDGGRTDELLCRLGVRQAEDLIKRYFGRRA
ncbi:MAG: hypothetical protein H6831_06810 [Planctomycetes bacterium]|nr:hypothetical protein [Planctomycetota bacterium]MCB9904101.1 hypothetical protein [Planctomycetota bacterium]